MDINYLLQREQIERSRAEGAPQGAAREAHRGLADGYRDRIDGYRRKLLHEAGLGTARPARL